MGVSWKFGEVGLGYTNADVEYMSPFHAYLRME